MSLNVEFTKVLGYGQDTEIFRPLYKSVVRRLSRQHGDEEQISSTPAEEAVESVAEPHAMNPEPDSDMAAGLSEDELLQGPSEEAALLQYGAPEQEEALQEPAVPDLADSLLDIFTTENIVDEDEQRLPQGLVDIEAHTLLSDCRDVVVRLRGARVLR